MKLDGIREDTYAYSDLDGLSRWAKELKREYPDLYLVGEIMDFDRVRLSYYFNDGTKNYLSSIADFGFSSEIYQLIVENKPIGEFYRDLANDFIYTDPNMMLTFLDNHDMGRFYSAVLGDNQKYLNALTLLFSMRGIPQLYYGNEIGMLGGHDPENRDEFPGGFGYGNPNAFDEEGRSENENLIYDQIKAFTGIRKEHPAIFNAKMKHDLQNDIYFVSRSDGKYTMLMAYNPGNKTESAYFGSIVSGKIMKIDWVKGPLKGEAKIKVTDKKIIVPPGEAVMVILK